MTMKVMRTEVVIDDDSDDNNNYGGDYNGDSDNHDSNELIEIF